MTGNTTKELADRVYNRLHEDLTRVGFVRCGHNPYTILVRETDDIVGWLGLGRSVARGDGAVRIGPNPGVLHRPLQRLVADLGGGEYPAALSSNIGYLMPQTTYVEYEFWPDSDERPEVARLIHDVEAYGLPYMQSMANLDAITEYLSRPNAPKLDAPYLLPVCHLLRGDSRAATASIGRFLTDERLRDYVIVEDYVRFTDSVRRLIEGKHR